MPFESFEPCKAPAGRSVIPTTTASGKWPKLGTISAAEFDFIQNVDLDTAFPGGLKQHPLKNPYGIRSLTLHQKFNTTWIFYHYLDFKGSMG